MTSKADSSRPQPDAYDHLWSLLPVFLVFLALVICFADSVPDRNPSSGDRTSQMSTQPSRAASVDQAVPLVADPSVPPASAAVTADAAVEAREISTF